jgi:hypothetical protein
LTALRRIILALTLSGLIGIASASKIVNMSGRAEVGTGDNVEIGGFIVSGTSTEVLVLRGLGPSLPFANRLADPLLRLYDANGTVIAQSNNWRGEGQEATLTNLGLNPSNDLEAAVRVVLPVGNYTSILSGVNGGIGIGLLEFYETEARQTRLVNLSERAHIIGGGDSQAIVGLTIVDNDPKDLLFRGIGPSLPLAGTLPDPYLVIYDGAGNVLYVNQNWKDSQQNAIAITGAAPSNDAEAAIRLKLGAGRYTAILKDYANRTGVGSLEVYDVTGAPSGTPTPTPAPTPTPQPQRLLWQDTREAAADVGRPNPQCCSGPSTPAVVKSSQLLSPAGAGLITVHLNSYAVGVCQYYCGPNPPPSGSWTAYARILNQFGTVVATGPATRGNAVSYFNWSGAPLYVQIMADSQAYYPNNDNVHVTYFDVYGP